MNNRKTIIFLSGFIIASILFAAIPAGYYDDAAGLSGNDLRLALHNIIDGHTQKTYEQVWAAFETTDIKANGKIWDMYTGIEFTFSDDQQTIGSNLESCYNREHSWPKSWANEQYPHYTDLFHLYPVQALANSHRSNLPYGEVGATVTYTSLNGTKKGEARSGLGYVGTVFEPIDEYKGDLARTYFYMSTRYYTEDAAWDSYGMTDLCELKDWAVSMLLNWHHDDSVSQKELDRIEAVYAIQENRNPFIDHPEYVDSIWNTASESFEVPTAQTASSVQSDRFTANWSEVSEATGYKLYVSENSNFSNHITNYGPKDVGNNLSETVTALSSSTTYYYRVKAYKTGEETGYSNVITVETAAPSGTVDGTKIFFSEYIEGSSYNKALEIYNGAGADIDLSKITIKLYTNGGTSPYRTLSLTGTLVKGEVYVIAHDNANATILAAADLTNATVMIYNGNDVLELYYNDTLVDRIGEVGSATYFAQDVTLVRKAEVLNGNTTYTASEWNSYAKDETSYLGSHSVSEEPTAIALVTFSAFYESGEVILQWVTASETENAAFHIFRNNEFLTSIEGAGTTSVTKHYEFIDSFVKPGNTYTYLLKDISYNGYIQSHNTMFVSVTIPSDGRLILSEGIIGSLSPNPFNPVAVLPLHLNQNADIIITLYDIFGRKCREITNENYAPGNYNIPVDASGFPSGVYVLHISVGKNKYVQKIVLTK